jgi:peptide/nickel transport system permease protein
MKCPRWWAQFRRQPFALVGLAILGTMTLMAVLAPWLSPHEAGAMFAPLQPPSRQHPFGTNDMGYDLWCEWLQGARFSLALGALAALGSTALGTVLGALAGYCRRAGPLIMRLVDVFLAVPRFPLIVLMAAFVRPGFGSLLLFFALFGWPTVARIVCARMLGEKGQEYAVAAEALGASSTRIFARHLLPAAVPLAFVRLVAEMQHVIIAESGLSFLGLGDPTARTWGMTLSHATRYPALFITDVWTWWVLPPGLAITLACLALALIGIGLESLTNPRLAR